MESAVGADRMSAIAALWCCSQAITGPYFSLAPVWFSAQQRQIHTQKTHKQLGHRSLPREIGLGIGAQVNIVQQAISKKDVLRRRSTAGKLLNQELKVVYLRGYDRLILLDMPF